MKRIIPVAVLTAITALTLTACSFSFQVGDQPEKDSGKSTSKPAVDKPTTPDTAETPVVAAADVEAQAAAALAPQLNSVEPEVTCYDDLPAEVGATITCNVNIDGVDYEGIVTVTTVSDDLKVKFDIDVPTYQG